MEEARYRKEKLYNKSNRMRGMVSKKFYRSFKIDSLFGNALLF